MKDMIDRYNNEMGGCLGDCYLTIDNHYLSSNSLHSFNIYIYITGKLCLCSTTIVLYDPISSTAKQNLRRLIR